jgi:hypothetical protein
MLVEQGGPDGDDGERRHDPGALVLRSVKFLRVREQRHHVRRPLPAQVAARDAGVQVVEASRGKRFSFRPGMTLAGYLGRMLRPGQDPGDRVQVDAELLAEDAAIQDARGDGVGPGTDPLAFQVPRRLDARADVLQEVAVVEEEVDGREG